MFEFYTWTLMECSAVTLLIALCVIAQTLTVVMSCYRRRSGIARIFENMLEFFLLFHIIVLSLLMGQEQQSHFGGLIVPTGYVEIRYISAVFVALFACVVMVYLKNAWNLLIITVSCVTLPLMETVYGNSFAWFYIFALLFWLIRGVCFAIMRYNEVVTNISVLSVKNAIDSMNTGVLFSEPEGFIMLVNVQMQKLMMVLTGRIHRNSRNFYEQLVFDDILPGCRKTEYEGQIVCLLPDETAWVFTRTEIQTRNKLYIQLTATDITQRWALTDELRRQEELLILRGEELKDMIVGLQALNKTRELQNAKLRAHDILGKRLTMLLHSVNSGQTLDYDLLRTQLQSLLVDLKSGQSAALPQEKLDNLQHTFQTIGVKILINGNIPSDEKKGYVFVDIISESVINAVRHGFASKIFVQMSHVGNAWYLEITDNGNRRSLSRPIREGGGISGMRSKLKPYGGALVVTNHPRFMLKVELPGGIIDV